MFASTLCILSLYACHGQTCSTLLIAKSCLCSVFCLKYSTNNVVETLRERDATR